MSIFYFQGLLALRLFIAITLLVAGLVLSLALTNAAAMAQTLDPTTIPKYENQLVIPPIYAPTVVTDPVGGEVVSHDYAVDINQFQQQMLPSSMGLLTTVWGYGGMVDSPDGPVYYRNAPGATFQATRGIPVNVQWTNNLTGSHLFAVDPTLHWANPNNMPKPTAPFLPFPPGYPEAQSPVPTVAHLHGGEVRSDSDGHPDAWFTASGILGPAYSGSLYTYPNEQPAATLWYHDHALGITRTNVLSGLAGMYLLSDPADTIAASLPSGDYDIPLVIQDRSFNSDGSLYYPNTGWHPRSPYSQHIFAGNTIVVNGSVWPNLDVERRQYRFRVVNGSNSRFYNISLSNGQSFTQVASDGGYLPAAAEISTLLLSPGERAELLIDFSQLPAGTEIIMDNDARVPYPDGDPVDPQTTGQIMRFTVADTPAVAPGELPAELNVIPELTPDTDTRTLALTTPLDENGHYNFLLNGQEWSAPVTELPLVGTTQDWIMPNMTIDSHPIHLHLVQFQVVSRQKYNAVDYYYAWTGANGEPPVEGPVVELPVDSYLEGDPIPPEPGETGWKDTVVAHPGEILHVRIRWAPQEADPAAVEPGVNLFPFDPSFGPGYVWHCHMLEHEDNEMMRPMEVRICEKPDLSVQDPVVFWDSLWDFYSRMLSVTWSINNVGTTAAYNAEILAGDATNGVTVISAMPVEVGDIAIAQTGKATIKYDVPFGVQYFRVMRVVTAQDGCGNIFTMP